MKVIISFLSISFLLATFSIHTHDEISHEGSSTQYMQQEQSTSAANQLHETADSAGSNAPTSQKIINYFSDMVHNILSILKDPHSLENVAHSISHLFYNLIHISLDLFKNADEKTQAQQEAIKHYFMNISPEEQAQFIQLIKEKDTQLMLKTKQLHEKETERKDRPEQTNHTCTNAQETQAVLGYFANIVNNFFNIVQDPEEPANVGHNLANMLANIVHIATEVMAKGLHENADNNEIMHFIDTMDNQTKTAMAEIIVARARSQA